MDITNEKTAEYIRLIREALGDKRYTHSVNVAAMCVKLAGRHNYPDVTAAYAAGILHDVRKEAPADLIKAETAKFGIGTPYAADGVELDCAKLHHAVAGAYYAREVLGLSDEIVLAIRFHTIARAGMSLLEKIVYMADLVSEERDFPDVARYRDMAFGNIDLAVFSSVKFTLAKVMSQNGAIPRFSFEAYDYYRER